MREAIYKGATRPAIVLGVPLLPALGLIGTGGLIGAWGAFLLSRWCLAFAALIVIPGIAWMRLVTKQDDQRVRQHWHGLLLALRCANRGLWACRIRLQYQGAGDFAVDNQTAQGRAQNRRVEVELYGVSPGVAVLGNAE